MKDCSEHMDIEKLLKLARSCLIERRLEETAGYCAQILERESDQTDALHILALVHYQTGDPARATELLERAIGASPEFVPAYTDLAAILQISNRVPEAISLLEKAIEIDPRYAEAQLNLGNAKHQLGEVAAAERHYRLALECDPDLTRGWVSLGNLLRTIRRTEESVDCFQRALRLAPTNAVIHNFLGAAYRDLGQTSDAISNFKKAVELDPDNADANANFGAAKMWRREFSSAIKYFDRSGTLDSMASALECLLHLEKFDEFFSRVEAAAQVGQTNLHIASISAYASQQLSRPDPYPFCHEPMNFVQVIDQPGRSDFDDDFLVELAAEAKRLESVWQPRGISTVKGYQTAPSLFRRPTAALSRLKEIIDTEVAEFRKSHEASQNSFIQNWPAKTKLNGWFVRLVSEGFQSVHNHPEGWLSGVFYLRLPLASTPPEGGIEFSLKNESYPAIAEDDPRRTYIPKVGQLVLFPSSLYHRTVPFKSNEERLCIAFDVAPA